MGTAAPGPTDAWTTLAGLARETSTIRLGTLVTSATFRLPGPLAVQVAGVDQMSGGRVELGLGAGWFEAEHTAYGIPFPPLGERFDRLEEQLAVITGLWDTPAGKTFSHDGTHYPVADSPALAKPVQEGGVPIIIGGGGKRRTPSPRRAVCRRVQRRRSRRPPTPAGSSSGSATWRREVGRDPDSLTYSAAQVVCVGNDEATLRRRAEAIGRDVDELRANGLAGSPDEVVEKIAAFEAVGAERIYLQVLDLSDLDHLADIADGRAAPGRLTARPAAAADGLLSRSDSTPTRSKSIRRSREQSVRVCSS